MKTAKKSESKQLRRYKPEEDGFTSLIVLDIDKYAEKYGNRKVSKSFERPAWLNAYVEENHIDCAQILQEALLRKFETDY